VTHWAAANKDDDREKKKCNANEKNATTTKIALPYQLQFECKYIKGVQCRGKDRKWDYFWASRNLFERESEKKSLYKYLPNKIVIVIIAWWIFMKTMLLFVIKVAISFVAYGAEASIASALRKGF
jgi:hypothetical protein